MYKLTIFEHIQGTFRSGSSDGWIMACTGLETRPRQVKSWVVTLYTGGKAYICCLPWTSEDGQQPED